MYLLAFAALLLASVMTYPKTVNAQEILSPIAQSVDADEATIAQTSDTDSEGEQAADDEKGEKGEEAEEEQDVPWKTAGVDLIINTFRVDYAASSSAMPGRRERHNTSFTSVNSIGIRSYHGRKSIGFSIGTPFVAGALQVPDSGAFHLGYQLDANWQVGLLAFIDFSVKSYYEDTDEWDLEEHSGRAVSTSGKYGSSSMSSALGGWLNWQVLDWWDFQFAVYQVRSTVRSSMMSFYDHQESGSEESESGVEYARINFSFSRRFQLSPKVEFAPKILVGLNAFYDRDFRYEDKNGEVEELNFEHSEGVYVSVTLGSFTYHL